MQPLEFKSMPLELTDLDQKKRTAILAHAVYGNVDLANDITCKGCFQKSWSENKGNIAFLLDHDRKQQPGKVIDVWDDDNRAYTKVKFGNHTLGNDVLAMMDDGIIKGASFGFQTLKAVSSSRLGKKIRELREVRHVETSAILSLTPINPEAGIVTVHKAMDPNLAAECKMHLDRMRHAIQITPVSEELMRTLRFMVGDAQAALRPYLPNAEEITIPDQQEGDFANKLLEKMQLIRSSI